MRYIILKASFAAVLVCFGSALANGQEQAKPADQQQVGERSSGASIGVTTAKVPVIIVGSAAKATWVTTKFTTKYVVAPVAKEIFLEMTPAMAKFAAKNALRYGVPIAAKWALL